VKCKKVRSLLTVSSIAAFQQGDKLERDSFISLPMIKVRSVSSLLDNDVKGDPQSRIVLANQRSSTRFHAVRRSHLYIFKEP
jgi:hypothetical protein